MSQVSKKIRANEQIRVPQVRLIASDGRQIGVVPTREALTQAQTEGFDLVEVSPAAKPPVCRIMDLGKYLYDLEKKDKEARKKQKVIEIKEIKMTSKIEEHDYQTKLRNARKFLERGDKVKLTLFFRGREIMHADLGQKVVKRFIADLSDISEVEKNEGLEGKTYQIYLMPSSGKKESPARNEETVKVSNESKGSTDSKV